jgi:hypothetical protein
MRHLHSVGANEVFLASGVYKHYEGETLTKLTEAWSIHLVPGGGRLVRIDKDARLTDGTSHLTEILMSPDDHVERLNVQLMNTASAAGFKTMHTSYVFLDEYVQITRKQDHAEPEYSEIALPASSVFVRLLEYHIFWGQTLKLSAAHLADDLAVFVPFHKSGHPPGKVVQGILPAVEEVTDDVVTLGKKEIACRRYRTQGNRLVWLDDHDIPVKIISMQGYVLDLLSNYAHR